MVRHDHRIEADGDTAIRECEETDRSEEGCGLCLAAECAPSEPSGGRRGQRHRRQESDVGPCEPASRDALTHERRPDADDSDGEDYSDQADTAMAAGSGLNVTLGL